MESECKPASSGSAVTHGGARARRARAFSPTLKSQLRGGLELAKHQRRQHRYRVHDEQRGNLGSQRKTFSSIAASAALGHG